MEKTVHDIRFENFEILIKEAGSVANLARACGYDKPAYLYQVRSKTKKPNGETLQIGKRMAAKLEQGMNKPEGWLDVVHSADELSQLQDLGGKKSKKNRKKSVTPETHQNQNQEHHFQAQAQTQAIQTVTLAFTGASGMPYGLRLLEELLKAGKTVWLLYSPTAQIVAQQEMNFKLPSDVKEAQKTLCQKYQVPSERLRVFGREEWFAPLASGSNVADAMVICPASMGTVAAVAHGLSENLIERAADVCLKERRPMVIVPREAPFSTLHLENLLKLSQLGCTILPPAAGFYHHPKTVDDMIDFVVARILDQLHIPHTLMKKWGE